MNELNGFGEKLLEGAVIGLSSTQKRNAFEFDDATELETTRGLLLRGSGVEFFQKCEHIDQ